MRKMLLVLVAMLDAGLLLAVSPAAFTALPARVVLHDGSVLEGYIKFTYCYGPGEDTFKPGHDLLNVYPGWKPDNIQVLYTDILSWAEVRAGGRKLPQELRERYSSDYISRHCIFAHPENVVPILKGDIQCMVLTDKPRYSASDCVHVLQDREFEILRADSLRMAYACHDCADIYYLTDNLNTSQKVLRLMAMYHEDTATMNWPGLLGIGRKPWDTLYDSVAAAEWTAAEFWQHFQDDAALEQMDDCELKRRLALAFAHTDSLLVPKFDEWDATAVSRDTTLEYMVRLLRDEFDPYAWDLLTIPMNSQGFLDQRRNLMLDANIVILVVWVD